MDRIEERAAQWGIESQYHDAFGRLRQVEPEVLSGLLELLSGNGALVQRRTPATLVVRHNREASVTVQAPPGTRVSWSIGGEESLAEGVGEAPVVRLPDDLPSAAFRSASILARRGRKQHSLSRLSAPSRAIIRRGFGALRCSFMACARTATGDTATSPIWRR
jgi:hypothetical protein